MLMYAVVICFPGTAGPVREGRVAREHCLLKSERPPQVTILALTRDAVARLPGGRGSRSLVCSLLRDSQYLAPVVTESQVGILFKVGFVFTVLF